MIANSNYYWLYIVPSQSRSFSPNWVYLLSHWFSLKKWLLSPLHFDIEFTSKIEIETTMYLYSKFLLNFILLYILLIFLFELIIIIYLLIQTQLRKIIRHLRIFELTKLLPFQNGQINESNTYFTPLHFLLQLQFPLKHQTLP